VSPAASQERESAIPLVVAITRFGSRGSTATAIAMPVAIWRQLRPSWLTKMPFCMSPAKSDPVPDAESVMIIPVPAGGRDRSWNVRPPSRERYCPRPAISA